MAISKGSGSPRSGGNLSDASAPMIRACRSIDGVSVELDQAGHPPAIDGRPQAGSPDEELVQVERHSRRIELILRRLVVHHPVRLQIPGETDAQAGGEHLGRRLRRPGLGRFELRVQRIDGLGPNLAVLDLLVAERLQVGSQLRELARLLLFQRLARLLLAWRPLQRRPWPRRRPPETVVQKARRRPIPWWAAPSGAPRPSGPRLSSTPRTRDKRPNTLPIYRMLCLPNSKIIA